MTSQCCCPSWLNTRTKAPPGGQKVDPLLTPSRNSDMTETGGQRSHGGGEVLKRPPDHGSPSWSSMDKTHWLWGVIGRRVHAEPPPTVGAWCRGLQEKMEDEKEAEQTSVRKRGIVPEGLTVASRFELLVFSMNLNFVSVSHFPALGEEQKKRLFGCWRVCVFKQRQYLNKDYSIFMNLLLS